MRRATGEMRPPRDEQESQQRHSGPRRPGSGACGQREQLTCDGGRPQDAWQLLPRPALREVVPPRSRQRALPPIQVEFDCRGSRICGAWARCLAVAREVVRRRRDRTVGWRRRESVRRDERGREWGSDRSLREFAFSFSRNFFNILCSSTVSEPSGASQGKHTSGRQTKEKKSLPHAVHSDVHFAPLTAVYYDYALQDCCEACLSLLSYIQYVTAN